MIIDEYSRQLIAELLNRHGGAPRAEDEPTTVDLLLHLSEHIDGLVQDHGAEIVSLAAERDALAAQVATLQDDLASARFALNDELLKRDARIVRVARARDWAALWKRAAKSRKAHEADYRYIKADIAAIEHVWARRAAAPDAEPMPDDYAAPDQSAFALMGYIDATPDADEAAARRDEAFALPLETR